MNKLYVGNLSPSVTVEDLKQLFDKSNLPVTDQVLLKVGYALVDFPDQNWAIKAIETLSGKAKLHGKVIEVDYSVPRNHRSRKIQIRNVPAELQWDMLDDLLSKYGTVQNMEQVTTDTDAAVVNVTYTSRDEAKEAMEKLSAQSEQQGLSVSYLLDEDAAMPTQTPSTQGTRTRRQGRLSREQDMSPFGSSPSGGREAFPLRLLVPAQYVGAIIGKEGLNIKNIAKETQARVEIRKEGGSEKAVSIYAAPQGCSAACRMILSLLEKEASGSDTEQEVPLKILAHNSLVGRLIGKEGRNLKKIEQETGAKITISSLQDLSLYSHDRTITVQGGLEEQCTAEGEIMRKLREANETTSVVNAMPGLNLSTHGLFSSGGMSMLPPPGLVPASSAGYNPFLAEQEVVYLLIPAQAVGALIGKKGQNIRDLARFAGATVKIAPAETSDDPERTVIITGSPDAQFKAQGQIFKKLNEENFFLGQEELEVQIKVPSSAVGRVIGKGGKMVNELQVLSSAEVIVPRDQHPDDNDEVFINIIGNFYASQTAQRKIREIVFQVRQQEQKRPKSNNTPSHQDK